MAEKHTLIDLIGAYDNFDEPQPVWNRSETIITLTATVIGFATACIIFRLYVRLFVIQSPGWDDLFVFLYLLTGIGGGVSLCLATKWGLGQHFLLLGLDDMRRYLKAFYACNSLYNMSTALIKISLMFQYLRIFDRGTMRIGCIAILTFICLWGFTYSFISWFACFPISDYWNWKPDSRCYGFGSLNPNEFFATYASQTGINMVLDVVVLAIPIPIYFRKDTAQETRLGLLGLFFMGGIVTSLSIWRLATIVDHRAATYPTFDPTWYGPISVTLGMLEVTAASICASVPVFWPIITARIDQIFVTREIKITRDNRFSADCDDQIELQRSTSEFRRDGFRRMHSAPDSPEGRDRSVSVSKGEKKSHYMDDFVLDQADPLREKTAFAVESQVLADGPKRKKSKTFRENA